MMHVLLGALAVASSFGLSIYLTICFSIIWTIYGIILFCKKLPGAWTIAVSAGLGLLLSLLLINELTQGTKTGLPIIFAVRRFEWLDYLLKLSKHTDINIYLRNLLNFLLLPINYLSGLGATLIFAIIYLKKNRQYITKLPQLFLLIIFLVCLFINTFIRSVNVTINDLGWRALIPLEFVLLIWSAWVLFDLNKDKRLFKIWGSIYVLIFFSFVSSGYDYYLCRTQPAILGGKYTFNVRSIYEELNNKIDKNAIVQHSPTEKFWSLEPFYGLYGHHQVVVCHGNFDFTMHPYKKEYFETLAIIKRLFENTSQEEARSILQHYSIDVMLLKSTDPLWTNHQSWIWQYPILAQNDSACAFLINKKVLRKN